MQINLVVGVILIGFGLITLAGRLFSWETIFRKRRPMQEKFGAVLGDAIHFGAYTAMPLAAGSSFLFGVFEL